MTNRRLVQRTLLAWAVLELAAAAQVRGPDEISLLTRWVRTAVEPAATMIVTSTLWFDTKASQLSDSQRLSTQNRILRYKVERLQSENAVLKSDVKTMIQGTANLELLPRSSMIPARCIARDLGRGSLRLLVLTDQIASIPADSPVFSAGGIVGRVFRTDGRTCWVETIVNTAAAIAVTTDDGSVQALAEGAGDSFLNIRFVPQRAFLQVGDRLYSSGGDGVYPPGLPVADIISVQETDDPFLNVRAQPVANIPAVLMAWLILNAETGSTDLKP